MGEVGRYIVRNQCGKIGIDPEKIRKGDLPKLSQLLSETMATFGADKARRVKEGISRLHSLEAIVDDEKDPARQMEGLYSLGELSRLCSDFDTALTYFERLADLSSDFGNQHKRALSYLGIGMVRNDMSDGFMALDSFERALELANKIGDRLLLARIYYGIGRCHLRKGDYEKALRYYAKSLDMGKDDPGLASQLKMDIGLVHDALGDYPMALLCIQEAIDIASGGAQVYDVARMYNNLGEVHKHLGNYEEAIKKYKISLDKAQSIKNDRIAAYALSNIAECHVKTGNAGEARGLLERALDMACKSRDEYIVGSVYLALGVAYGKDHDLNAMNDSFDKAEKTFKRIQSPYDLGVSFFEHGKALKSVKKRAEAKIALTKALAIFKEIKSIKFVQQAERELDDL